MADAIRPATIADIAAIDMVVRAAYRGGSVRGWTDEVDVLDGSRTDPEALGAILTDASIVVLLAERDGVLLGCVQVTDGPGDVAHLGMLSVDPSRQAGGVGRSLVRAAESHAAARLGRSHMALEVIGARTELVAWYERLGYCRTGRTRAFEPAAPRFGSPRRAGLTFVELAKELLPVASLQA